MDEKKIVRFFNGTTMENELYEIDESISDKLQEFADDIRSLILLLKLENEFYVLLEQESFIDEFAMPGDRIAEIHMYFENKKNQTVEHVEFSFEYDDSINPTVVLYDSNEEIVKEAEIKVYPFNYEEWLMLSEASEEVVSAVASSAMVDSLGSQQVAIETHSEVEKPSMWKEAGDIVQAIWLYSLEKARTMNFASGNEFLFKHQKLELILPLNKGSRIKDVFLEKLGSEEKIRALMENNEIGITHYDEMKRVSTINGNTRRSDVCELELYVDDKVFLFEVSEAFSRTRYIIMDFKTI